MAPEITDQIANLRALPRLELLALWLKLYKRDAPTGIRREILVPFLAYKIQEDRHGGLKPVMRAELRRIAREIEGNRRPGKRLTRRKAKPGTRLLRPWRGAMHEVFVTDSGYEYRGVGYGSLSEIARKITGTRWSGPAFFGLNKATFPPRRGNA